MFALLSLVLCFAAQIIATPQRVIVDDQYGDPITGAVPIYTAPQTGEWNQGATCVVCSAGSKIDRDNGLIVNKTWHDGTSGLDGAFSIDFNFTGKSCLSFFLRLHSNPVSRRLHCRRLLYSCWQQLGSCRRRRHYTYYLD